MEHGNEGFRCALKEINDKYFEVSFSLFIVYSGFCVFRQLMNDFECNVYLLLLVLEICVFDKRNKFTPL